MVLASVQSSIAPAEYDELVFPSNGGLFASSVAEKDDLAINHKALYRIDDGRWPSLLPLREVPAQPGTLADSKRLPTAHHG